MLVLGGEIYWLFGGLIGKIATIDRSSGYWLLGECLNEVWWALKILGRLSVTFINLLNRYYFTLAGGWKKFYFLQRHPTHFTNQRVKLVTSLTLPPNQRCHFIPFRDDFTKPLALL